MKTALQTFGCFALGAVVVLCLAVAQVAVDFDHMVRAVSPKVGNSLDQVAIAAANVNAATKTLAEASAAEKDNWTKASMEAAKTGGAVRLFVDRVDRQLNDKTLPNFDAQLSAFSTQSQVSLKQAGDAAEQLGFAAQALSADAATLDGTLDDFDETLNDHHIAESLARIADATQQLSEASGHANKILADGEIVADHYEAEIMKPVSLGRRVGEYLLTFGSDARVLFTGGK